LGSCDALKRSGPPNSPSSSRDATREPRRDRYELGATPAERHSKMSHSVRLFSHFPLEFAGGGERFATLLGDGLTDAGWRFEMYSDARTRVINRRSPSEVRSDSVGFDYRVVPFRDYAVPVSRPLLRPCPPLELISRETTNLMLIDRPPPIAFLRRVAESDLRLCFLIHGLAPEDRGRGSPEVAGYQWLVRQYLYSGRQWLRRPQFSYQTLTRATRHFLTRLGIPGDQIEVIPNGIPFVEYGEPSETSQFKVVFLGRLERVTKGIDFLAAAIARLLPDAPRDFSISIVGSGRDSDLLSRFAGHPQVRICGYLPDVEKRATLADSSLMLVTSRVEPFSIASIEALASGVPILTTPSSGPSEIVSSDGRFGSVVAMTPSAFATEIIKMYERWRTNPRSYLETRVRIRELARRIYDSPRMIERYASLIERLGQQRFR
jgi:glycosyltransferase involved in cell wall biosynthesis